MRKWLQHPAAKPLAFMVMLLTLALIAAPTLAQIVINYTFTSGTVIDPDQMNDNFTQLSTKALNRTGGTMTGDLLFTDATFDIGKSAATRPRDLFLSRDLTVGRNTIHTGTTVLTGAILSDLLFTDNTYDIGKTGATRPRDLFLSRNGTVGGAFNVTGLLTGTGSSGFGGYVLVLGAGITTGDGPADSVTYYSGALTGTDVGYMTITESDAMAVIVPRSGTVKRVTYTTVVRAGTLGTSETSTASLRNTTTATDALISSGVKFDAKFNTYTSGALSLTVTAGDALRLKLQTPAWATNPTPVWEAAWVYIE